MTGLLVAAWLGSAAVQADEAVLEATEVAIEDGVARGKGPVRIAIGDDAIDGAGFTLDLDSATLTVHDGAWARKDGALTFERADVALEDLTGVVLRGLFRGAQTDLIIRGDTIEILGETRFIGEGVGITTCDCESGDPIWEVTARRVRVTLDDSVSFWGGWIRAGGVPILPIPYGRASLVEDRTRLDFPELRVTGDGFELGQPLIVPMDEVEWRMTPKWHQTRGARVENAFELGSTPLGAGGIESVLGFDGMEGVWRAGLEAELARHVGRIRHGADVTWLSDSALLEDYDADYLDRNLDFFERRAFVQTGKLRLAHRSVQADMSTTQMPVSLTWWDPANSGKALEFWNSAGLSWVGEGTSEAIGGTGRWVGFGQAGVTGSDSVGPFLAEAEIGAIAALEDLTGLMGVAEVLVQPVAAAHLSLPMWGDHGAVRHVFDPGFSADLRPDQTGEVYTAWVGPRLTSRWLSSTGVPVQLDVSVPTDGEAWAPLGRAWVQSGSYWASVAGEVSYLDPLARSLTAGGGFDDGHKGFTFRAIAADTTEDDAALAQVSGATWWTLNAGGDRWTPSAHLRADLQEQTLLEQGVGLRFRTRCNCLDVSTVASWSEDRIWPEVFVSIDIRE